MNWRSAGRLSQWSTVESSGPTAETCGASVLRSASAAMRSVHGKPPTSNTAVTPEASQARWNRAACVRSRVSTSSYG